MVMDAGEDSIQYRIACLNQGTAAVGLLPIIWMGRGLAPKKSSIVVPEVFAPCVSTADSLEMVMWNTLKVGNVLAFTFSSMHRDPHH